LAGSASHGSNHAPQFGLVKAWWDAQRRRSIDLQFEVASAQLAPPGGGVVPDYLYRYEIGLLATTAKPIPPPVHRRSRDTAFVGERPRRHPTPFLRCDQRTPFRFGRLRHAAGSWRRRSRRPDGSTGRLLRSERAVGLPEIPQVSAAELR